MHNPISRRMALKATGVAVSIPLLESMSCAFAADEVPPKRMILICNTLGLHPPSLFPRKPGKNYRKTDYLKLLEDHRDDLTLFSGLSHPDQNGKQPHDNELTWLTAARNPGLGGFKNTISVDQLAAAKIGRNNRFRSIALSTNTRKSQSYNSNGVMLPAEDKPSSLFAKLFLQGSPKEVRQARQDLSEGKSVLDHLAEQTKSLKRKASRQDHRQLDEYFSAVRAAESDLVEAEAWLDRPKPRVDEKPPKDIADSRELVGRTRSMFNLIPLIVQTDSSRIITMVIQDHLVVPNIQGVNSEHHNLSHHGQDPEKIKQLKIIEAELLKCFSSFLKRMSQSPEGTGSLLDHSSILFGSNLGNANAHDPLNLPIIVAGGGHKHGQYIAYDKNNNTPLCNLFVHLLNHIGVETESFATSTGTLTW